MRLTHRLTIALLMLLISSSLSARDFEEVRGSYTLTGVGGTCVEAHARNRVQLAEKARVQCVNKAGKVKVVNLVAQNYDTISCTREGIKKHIAEGRFTFRCSN
ncbi:MAG: hypothetical protein MUE46_09465 [Xanthomonadales bacterium]|nr:hypothetical protein [Xanthomonadales bacterium]